MGWLFAWNSRKELVDHLVRNEGGKPVVDHGGSGNEFYTLMEVAPNDFLIVQWLLACSDGQWGYKGVSEDMGPVRVNCPERLLKKSTCQHPNAVKWREQCRQVREGKREAKRKLSALKRGDIFYIKQPHRIKNSVVVRCVPVEFRGFYSKRQIVEKPSGSVVYTKPGQHQLWKTKVDGGLLIP